MIAGDGPTPITPRQTVALVTPGVLRSVLNALLVLVIGLAGSVPVSAQDHRAGGQVATGGRERVATLELLHKQLAEAKRRQAIVSTPETERDLARQYEGLGILDAAFDHYRIALRLQPRDTTSLDAVARIWRDWGYPHLGLSSAYRAVYFSPKRAAAQNTLGTLLLQLGNVDAARERFERARQLDPEAAYPLNNMCFLELKTGRTDDAVRLCRVALDRDPTSVRSRNNLVVALAKGGDLDGATAVIHEDASSAVAAYNHGVLLLAMGKRDDARDAFARARVADPSYLPALNRLRVMNTAYRGFQ